MSLALALLGALRAALRTRTDLALENLALRQQLALLSRRSKRPRFGRLDRAFWLWLSNRLSVANIHPRPGSTAPPCPSNLVIPLHGRLVSVMQASEPRPRHSSAAWNLGYCRAAAGGGFLC